MKNMDIIREAQVSIVLKGAEGAEKIKELMDNLRKKSA